MKNKPECYVPERPIPEIYHGIPTFMGLPKIERKEDLPNYDVVFSGIPFEGVCTWGGFSGTELQPKTVLASDTGRDFQNSTLRSRRSS